MTRQTRKRLMGLTLALGAIALIASPAAARDDGNRRNRRKRGPVIKHNAHHDDHRGPSHDGRDRGHDRQQRNHHRGHDRKVDVHFHIAGHHGHYGRHQGRQRHGGGYVPGHFVYKTQRVLIEPAHYDKLWYGPVFETRYGGCGQSYKVTVSNGYYKSVHVPARYEGRPIRRWVPGHYRTAHNTRHRGGFHFVFGSH